MTRPPIVGGKVFYMSTSRSSGRLHWAGRWANEPPRACCTGSRVNGFGRSPWAVLPEDRCRHNGCRQQWDRFQREADTP